MGIYIKDMEMPTNCFTDSCPCLDRENGRCQADKEYRRFVDGDRPYWCPLIELPPHGRLIDADALDIYRREEQAWEDYNRNIHDRGDDSLCDKWECEVKDVAPVRHGRFVRCNRGAGYKCSVCKARVSCADVVNGNHRFCYKCGAKMDLEVNE